MTVRHDHDGPSRDSLTQSVFITMILLLEMTKQVVTCQGPSEQVVGVSMLTLVIRNSFCCLLSLHTTLVITRVLR